MADPIHLTLSLASQLEDERAIHTAAAAFRSAAETVGWTVVTRSKRDATHRVDVRLSQGTAIEPLTPGTVPTAEEQRYRIEVVSDGDRTHVTLTADGVLGAAYGVIRLADRIRTRRWPPEDAGEWPRFPQRFGIIGVAFAFQETPPYVDREKSKNLVDSAIQQLDHALLAGATAVLHYDTQSLVPWDSPKWSQRSAVCRELYREVVRAAHERRMRIYPMGDEFLYLPEWFAKAGAKLSTGDPKFWDALKSKYRGLLRELPEIDGVATRVGEMIPKGDLMAWDLIHTGEDRSLEGNYRRFVKAMHEVVVGEFERQFFHRTWTVNTWEQASVPEIYARTFNDEIPAKNLILCIKTTTGDQWEWQPLNPTFGVTQHATAVTVETARAQDYLSGPPDFAVEFAQAGLEWALEKGAVATMINQRPRWEESLWAGMEYVAWRLAWNPYQPLREVVADWVRATVGPEIADRVADLLLDLDDIHREGFHIHGVAYHTWEPFRHARWGWICRGNPFLDRGRGHHRHLRDLYLMAKPELESGLRAMAEHTSRYDRWLDQFRSWVKELPHPERAQWLEVTLVRGQDNLHVNLAYVEAFLRCFDYADNSDSKHRDGARRAVSALERELKLFKAKSNMIVQGIEEFLRFASRGIENIETADREMREAPGERDVERILLAAREYDERLIERGGEKLHSRWRGTIDSRDVLRIRPKDGTWAMEHCLGDHAATYECVIGPPTSGPGRFAVRMTLGRERGWAYILEQPTEENGQTLPVLLEDIPPGAGAHEIEVWWVPS